MYFLVINRGVFIDEIYHVGEDRDKAIQRAIELCEEENPEQLSKHNQDRYLHGYWILGHDGTRSFKVGYTVKGVGFIDDIRRM